MDGIVEWDGSLQQWVLKLPGGDILRGDKCDLEEILDWYEQNSTRDQLRDS